MTAVWDNFIGPLQMSNRYKKLLIALIHKKIPATSGNRDLSKTCKLISKQFRNM